MRSVIIKTKLISLAAIFLLLVSCNGKKAPDKKISDSQTNSNTSTATDNVDCCFASESDFAPFIPNGNQLLTKPENGYFSSLCSAEYTDRHSSYAQRYQIDAANTTDPTQAKYITLTIKDYCSNPAQLKSEIEQRKQHATDYAGTNNTVKYEEIRGDNYAGFRYSEGTPGSQLVYLWVMVDGRFSILIEGANHLRTDARDQLFDMIPLKQLAAFKK